MSRNDPRTQRGLAVARRMSELERERQYRAAQHAKGMSEIAWYVNRYGEAGVRAAMSADARGGLDAVRQVLAGAGLTQAGLDAFEAQYQRGGLQVVGAAVQAQIQHEAAVSAEHEAATALEDLRPEQWQAAAQTLATGGPEALYREAVALGLSPAVAARAVEYVATSGVDQARQAITQQSQARAQTEAAQAAAKRDLEAAQKDATGSPLANPVVHEAALAFYAAHAPALAAAGVGARSGESPAAWLVRVANAGGDMAAKVAKATGTAPEIMARVFTETRARSAEHEMGNHLRSLDAATGKKASGPDTTPHAREEAARRAALERAAEALGHRDPDDEPSPASDELDLQMMAADEYHRGAKPGSTFYPATSRAKEAAGEILERAERSRAPEPGIRGDMERAAARLAGQWSESSQAERPESRGGGGMDVRESIEAADRALNNGGSTNG